MTWYAKDVLHAAERVSLQVYRYAETKQNNLSYWGLDYPPLSAYQVRHPPMANSCLAAMMPCALCSC